MSRMLAFTEVGTRLVLLPVPVNNDTHYVFPFRFDLIFIDLKVKLKTNF